MPLRAIHKRHACVLLLWALGIGAGFLRLARYEATPGRAATPDVAWSVLTGLKTSPDKATLIVAAHPNCPCSQASLGELAELLARNPGRLTCYVLFVTQAANGADPSDQCKQSDLWKTAAAISGVTCVVDNRNLATDIFHARTSGQVFLYDTGGKLRFSGGVTSGRGHAGPNEGIEALSTFLSTGIVSRDVTPVYGCSLR